MLEASFLPSRLRQLMEANYMSVRRLSEEAGLSVGQLRAILNGRHGHLSVRAVYQLARAFQMPMRDFIDYVCDGRP